MSGNHPASHTHKTVNYTSFNEIMYMTIKFKPTFKNKIKTWENNARYTYTCNVFIHISAFGLTNGISIIHACSNVRCDIFFFLQHN